MHKKDVRDLKVENLERKDVLKELCVVLLKEKEAKDKMGDITGNRMKDSNPMYNEESKQKRLDTIKEKYPNWGNFNKGRKRPDLSEYNKHNPRKGKNHPRYGMKSKESTKDKISKSRLKGFKNGKIIHPKGMLGKTHPNKGKKFEEIYGKEKSNKLKNILSIITKRYLESHPDHMKNMRINVVLPMKDTSIELKIQEFLTTLHIEYFTHKYMSEITHDYQCDIYIPSQKGINQKTIIECDGCFFHACPTCKPKEFSWTTKRRDLDTIRTKELIEKGFRVLRLWEHEIKVMDIKTFQLNLMEVKNG